MTKHHRVLIQLLTASTLLPVLLSCSGHETDDSGKVGADTTLVRYNLFSDPPKYADLVRRAEEGDQGSLALLISYYSYPENPDMRNLLYWSDKQSSKIGPTAYTNYILALSEQDCDEAWHFLEAKYPNIRDFAFHRRLPNEESIDGKCLRKPVGGD
jgi:hypothetical protein